MENLTSSDANSWKECKRGWDEKIEKTIILKIDWLQAADLEDEMKEKNDRKG